jgi:hypothetical protein
MFAPLIAKNAAPKSSDSKKTDGKRSSAFQERLSPGGASLADVRFTAASGGPPWNFATVPVSSDPRRHGKGAPGFGGNWLPVQKKLIIGRTDDPLEHEADAVANRVMQMADPQIALKTDGTPRVRRECAECEKEEQLLQRKVERADTVPNVEAPETVHRAIGATGQPLDAPARSFFESRFGYDFGSVRLHTNTEAARSARQIGARAYTVGSNIVLGEGQHTMSTQDGRRLLAHELAHVVQQGAAGTKGGFPKVAGMTTAAGSLRRVSLRVQRQGAGCLKLLSEPGSSNIALGEAVQIAIVRDFAGRVGNPATFVLPDGSAAPWRTEWKGKEIPPQIFSFFSGEGKPDLAYKSRSGNVMLLAEIKPANTFGLAFAEEQLANYLIKGNANEELKAELGVKVFSPMFSQTYTPPPYINVLRKKVRVMWCGPGVIVYKAVEEKEEKKKKKKKKEEEEEEKKKKKKGDKEEEKEEKKKKKGDEEEEKKKGKGRGGNIGFGIGILSSGSGSGNASFGVSIMSHGVAYGTVSAGVVYDSNGNAVGAASLGAGSRVSGNVAGSAAIGLGSNVHSDAALSGTLGAAKDTDTTGVANVSAGTGKQLSTIAAATATHGHAENKDDVVAAQAGKAQGAAGAGGKAGSPQTGLEVPGSSQAETQKAIEAAKEIDSLLQKATPAQKDLMAYLAQTTGNFEYDVPDPQWVKEALTATADLSENDIAFLQKQKWVPGKISAADLRKKINERLKNRDKPQGDETTPADPGKAQEKKDGKGDAANHPGSPAEVKKNVTEAEKKITGASLDDNPSADPTKKESDSEQAARLLKRATAFKWSGLHAPGVIEFGKEGKVYGQTISGAFYYSSVIDGKRVRVTADVSGILTKDGADDVFEIRSSSIVVTTDKRVGPGSAIVGAKVSLKRN